MSRPTGAAAGSAPTIREPQHDGSARLTGDRGIARRPEFEPPFEPPFAASFDGAFGEAFDDRFDAAFGGATGRARPTLEPAGRDALADADASRVIGHLPRVSTAQRVVKRTVDVLGSIVGLALAAPLLLVLVAAVRIDSPGRALFVQERVGRDGRRFRCLKLRTMCEDAEERLQADESLRAAYEANGFKLPVECDPRVTSFGRFLRASSLDELPQLWNVLRGDMSLVGPRPVVEAELVHYGAARDLLLSVRPGITGAWAVSGRSCVNYPERADIELAYARGWTVGEDLRILGRTVGVVLQRQGAH